MNLLDFIFGLVKSINHHHHHHHHHDHDHDDDHTNTQQHGTLVFGFRYADLSFYGATHMTIILKDDQQIELAVNYVDARGNPATLDAAPVWASSDESVAMVAPAADGLSAIAIATGRLGSAQVTATVAGLPTAVADITVVADNAVAAVVTAGVPSLQPAFQPSTLTPVTPEPAPAVDPTPAPAVDPTPAPATDTPTPATDTPATDAPAQDPTTEPVPAPAPAPAPAAPVGDQPAPPADPTNA